MVAGARGARRSAYATLVVVGMDPSNCQGLHRVQTARVSAVVLGEHPAYSVATSKRKPILSIAVRTLLVANNYYYLRGGAERVFFAQMELFRGRGWRVVPFAMRHPENERGAWQEYFVDELELGGRYGLTGTAVRAAKAIYSFEARRRLAGLLGRVRPDVAHLHNIYHHISPSIIGALKARAVPVVMSLHDLKIACPAYRMLSPQGICERCRDRGPFQVVRNRCLKGSRALSGWAYLESRVHRLLDSYGRVDRFIVPSRFYVEKFAQWGVERQRLVHVPNFVDGAALRPVFAPGRAFFYFGRLSREKGVHTLVEAAARTGQLLWIAGEGPEESALRAQAARCGARVEFFGRVAPARLHAMLAQTRAAVLPSEWYENAPLSVLEAYALGTPVIGARIGGIPELIREGETGLTFESGSVEELAAVLERVARMPDAELETMGRKAREWVVRGFSREAHLAGVLKVYEELGVTA